MTALPTLTAIGVNNIQADSANLIGTINTQGITGTCWFEYGTTSALGSSTPIQTVNASGWPQTFTASLAMLTTGAVYYFAIAGTTAAGTVTSTQLTFTPTAATVTNASQPGPPVLTPQVVIPHVTFPLKIKNSQPQIAEQGSIEDVLSCVQMIVACPAGTCPELPSFGRPDPTFAGAPPDTNALVAAIRLWEPRADEDAVVQALDQTQANWGITLTTQLTGQ